MRIVMSMPVNPGIIALIASVQLLIGCSANPAHVHQEASRFLHDEIFPSSGEYSVESPDQVFALGADAEKWLDENIIPIRSPSRRGKALVQKIFDQSSLNLSYESTANTVASETYRSRSANCLSMSILAYSMAQYAGFDASFREVNIPEYWERRDRYSLMNRHINLVLREEQTSLTTINIRQLELHVDFRPQLGARKFSSSPITRSRALAMFYNNKGIDALLDRNMDQAYAYLKSALLQDPGLDMTLVNLGLLYNASGHDELAIESYRYATQLNRSNQVAAEGLALLLEKKGLWNEARGILAEIERERRGNPWYLYILGEEAYDDAQWKDAIRYFRKAIALEPDNAEFYFGMAKALLSIGDHESAERWLHKAERNADYPDQKVMYRNKISALSNL